MSCGRKRLHSYASIATCIGRGRAVCWRGASGFASSQPEPQRWRKRRPFAYGWQQPAERGERESISKEREWGREESQQAVLLKCVVSFLMGERIELKLTLTSIWNRACDLAVI